MTELDIARNASAVRNLAARLERLGYDGDCYAEAELIAMNLLTDGYRALELPPPLHGPSSTEEGRARARRIFEESRAAAVAQWDAVHATRLRRSAEERTTGTPTTPRTDTTTAGDTARSEEKR